MVKTYPETKETRRAKPGMQDCVICSQRYRLAWHRLSVSGGAGLVRHAPVFKKLLYETKIVMLEMFYCQWDHMAHISMFSPAASWIPVTSDSVYIVAVV